MDKKTRFCVTSPGNKQQDKIVKGIAEGERIKTEMELLNDRFHFQKKEIIFSQLVQKIILTKEPSNAQLFRQFLHYWEELYGADKFLSQITLDDCEQFKIFLLSKVSPNSASIYFSKLNYVIKYALDNDMIGKNPARKVKVKCTETVPRFLTISEIEKLVHTECPNSQVKLAFLFSTFTGLRISDVLNLRWDNIKENCLEIIQKKTQKVNRVPLCQLALKILENLGHTDEYVFHLPQRSTITYMIRKWAINSGIPKFNYHSSRHSFGCLLISSKVDILAVQKLMGHRRLETTLRYARIQDKSVNEAIEQLKVHTSLLLK